MKLSSHELHFLYLRFNLVPPPVPFFLASFVRTVPTSISFSQELCHANLQDIHVDMQVPNLLY